MCPVGGRVETELAAAALRYTLGCSKNCSVFKSSVKDVIYSCCIVQRSYFDHRIENVIQYHFSKVRCSARLYRT